MKKLYYYHEKTKWFYLALVMIMTAFLCVFSDDREAVLISAMIILLGIYKGFEGFSLLYKKYKCKKYGEVYNGRITGRKSFIAGNMYLYKFEVIYDVGKVFTAYVQPKYAERLKNRKCKVYVYKKLVYVDGYALCEKGEKGIEIQTRH